MVYTGTSGFASITYMISVQDVNDTDRLCDWFVTATNDVERRYAQITIKEPDGNLIYQVRLIDENHEFVREFCIDGNLNSAAVFGSVFHELSDEIEKASGTVERINMVTAMAEMTIFVLNSTTEV